MDNFNSLNNQNSILWCVYRDDDMLDILMYGTYEECRILLVVLKRVAYVIKPRGFDHRCNIRYVIDVKKMLDILNCLNVETRHIIVKRIIKFGYAPPPLIRQNAVAALYSGMYMTIEGLEPN